jgi:hypothetical protein
VTVAQAAPTAAVFDLDRHTAGLVQTHVHTFTHVPRPPVPGERWNTGRDSLSDARARRANSAAVTKGASCGGSAAQNGVTVEAVSFVNGQTRR